MDYDVIVVGSGCAGLTAALNLARSGKKVLVLEGNSFGGQIAFSPKVENFPSLQEISGAAFADNLLSQALSHGVDADLEKVEKVIPQKDGFVVVGEYAEHTAKAVVLATGVEHKHLPVKKAELFEGKGVGYCAVCDGSFYAGKEVAVLGDGNSALQYALYLTHICPKVTIVTLFDRFFGDDELVKRLHKSANITWLKNKNTVDFLGEEHFEGLCFDDGTQLKTDAVFIAIGLVPHNEAFKDLVELDKDGYIVAQEDCKTNVRGIYAAGDCRTKKVRQLTTASADGAVCAFELSEYLDK